MPVRLSFEKKKILLFGYTKEKKKYSNRFEFWYFPPYFDSRLFVYIMQINITFRRFKENLA